MEREPIMKRYCNQKFTNQHFSLDDGVFIDCTFINCSLEYSGGDFYLQNLSVENCQLIYRGPAKNTIDFMQKTGLSLSTVPGALPGSAGQA